MSQYKLCAGLELGIRQVCTYPMHSHSEPGRELLGVLLFAVRTCSLVFHSGRFADTETVSNTHANITFYNIIHITGKELKTWS